MSDIQIILNKHVDRDKIDSMLVNTESYIVEVVDNYSNNSTSTYNLDLGVKDDAFIEAVGKTIDQAAYLIENNALIWKIVRTGKSFKTEDSYQRDSVSTKESLTPLDDGTTLKLVFEIPGFSSNTQVEIDLWYNMEFNPTDLAALADIGIVLSGDGKAFSFTNTTDCKLHFKRPDGVSKVYIIDYDFSNDVISA